MRFPPGGPAPVRGGRSVRRRIGPATITALAVALLAAACQAPGTSGSGNSGSAKFSPITVAAVPGVDNAPLYLAASNGLFRKAGLQVTIQDYTTTAKELQALQAGKASIAAGDYTDFFFAENNDPDLLIVADGYDGAPNVMEVLTLPGSDITTPEDLAGKTIGTPEAQEIPFNSSVPYSLPTLATQSVLQNDGVNLTTVHWKPMASQDLVGALSSHQVDAILVTEPYIYQAESQIGAVEVVDSLSGATANLPLSGYFTTTSFAAKNAATLRAFRSTLLQAQGESSAGGNVQSVLAHYSGMNKQTASMVTIGQYPTSVNSDSMQRVADLMYDFGMLSGTLSVSLLVFH